jgi:DNA-binding CsgD family transcriptional regulator
MKAVRSGRSARPTAEELRALYWDSRENLIQIGARFGVAPGTVWHWMQRFGIATRSKGFAKTHLTPETHEEICTLYASGMSAQEVSLKMGLARRVVSTHVKTSGLSRGRDEAVTLAHSRGIGCEHSINAEFFDVLTEDSAWVLGLIVGDGNVFVIDDDQYAMTLAGSSDVLGKVAELMGFSGNLERGKGTNGLTACWRLKFYNRHIVERLTQLGVHPNKARTARLPMVDERLVSHLLRGIWDSDGSVSHSAPLKMGFGSASRWLAEDVLAVVKTVTDTKCRVCVRIGDYGFLENATYCTFCLGNKDSRLLSDFLYAGSRDKTRCASKYSRCLEHR